MILCRYTTSGNVYFQQIGRALSSDFKYTSENPIILDIVDNKYNIKYPALFWIPLYNKIKNSISSKPVEESSKSLFMINNIDSTY